MVARLVTLAVFAVLAVEFGALVVAFKPSVHVGATAPYQDPAVVQPYEAHLVTWQTGSPAVAGWSRNNTFADCPSLVIWVKMSGRDGYIGAGPVAAGQPVGWSGRLQDAHGKSVPITTVPRVTASCQ